jgi:hypothetical protein
MNINDVHNTILYFLNKEQNGFVTHEEIDLVLDKSQMVLFNQYHNNPKQVANSAKYGESQRMDDALSPFKQRYTFTSIATPSGIITLPNDYMHLISLYTTVYNNTLQRNVYSAVQVLNEEELIERLESQVLPVTPDDPIAIMNSQNRIQLFPESPATGGVYYFKRPAVPVFSYTQSGRTVTYNPATSTQLEWRDMDIMNVIVIALSYYGLNMSSEMVMQFALNREVQGQ